MFIVADSGSTKVSWRIVTDSGEVVPVSTAGINPVFTDDASVARTLTEEILSVAGETFVGDIFFYGAGIVDTKTKERLRTCFKSVFPMCALYAESDMLAAARALFGHNAGIACILGTGSNSCFYDGEKIAVSTKAGGFILGDEAGGAYFGKRLLSDYIKGVLPKELERDFSEKFGLDYASIVSKVYKEPLPGRFLASFSPFLYEHKESDYVSALLKNGFEAFLRRNLHRFDTERYSVSFVGSIAYYYSDILRETVSSMGMKPGIILKEPIDALVGFHKKV